MIQKEYFPDGVTQIDEWFYQSDMPQIKDFPNKYVLTDYGIKADGNIYTKEIQSLIDKISQSGGGLLVVPKGVYYTGALYFKQGVHLYVEKGGVLKGSDDISDYPVCETRMEGETCLYFPALINVDNVDGFTMFGEGTVDGNGERFWKSFWIRRSWNPQCTNKDEQRPRLVYISNSQNICVAGLNLINSPYWTNHIYKCHHVKYLYCNIRSQVTPVQAPSTDALDIDVCHDVLVKGCTLFVNDDSVVLKGGKGPWADELPENGVNERILIEDCIYEYCHGCLTCGSESIANKNILMRRGKVLNAYNMVWLKLRPDTPQCYEQIVVENIEGKVNFFLTIYPWTQFFDLKGRTDKPKSLAKDIVIRNCQMECVQYMNVTPNEEQYHLSNFTFENIKIQCNEYGTAEKDCIENAQMKNVCVEVKN